MLKLNLEIIRNIMIINFQGSLTKEDYATLKMLYQVIEKHELYSIIYNFQDLVSIDKYCYNFLEKLINLVKFHEGIQLLVPENYPLDFSLPRYATKNQALQILFR